MSRLLTSRSPIRRPPDASSCRAGASALGRGAAYVVVLHVEHGLRQHRLPQANGTPPFVTFG